MFGLAECKIVDLNQGVDPPPAGEDNAVKANLAPVLTAATAIVTGRTTKNNLDSVRLARERRTMSAMVRIYCRDRHHEAANLCPECRQFLDYSNLRLERCRFGEQKPTCAKCPVHCYQRDRREQARIIMRYAGPRMLWEHPVLSVRHWLDGFRKVPEVLPHSTSALG
jgi:YbgA-like uncharacterized protein